MITTVAGTGVGGYSGDGGPAIAAQLNSPQSVTVDGTGNLYIADTQNHRIRKVDTSGVITTVAGTGAGGYSGDGGSATAAQLDYPHGVTVDGTGNLYIADTHNHRIRKVDTSGVITTVAGNGVGGYSGDGGAATAAQLNSPQSVTIDDTGNLYIADRNNHRIRKVDISGVITTVAGNGAGGYSGDDGSATAAQLNNPFGVTVDGTGNIYIADTQNHRIRKVDTSGVITTVAGNGAGGYSGDDGSATAAQLSYPYGVTVDSAENLNIADTYNHRIRKVDTSGVITTVAGTDVAGYFGDDGSATAAQLYYPTGVTVDGTDSLYIADTQNHRIRKVADDFDGDGFLPSQGDCDDTNASVYPGAPEACDALDNNCDGFVDENLTQQTICGVGACAGNTGIETCSSGVWWGDTVIRGSVPLSRSATILTMTVIHK